MSALNNFNLVGYCKDFKTYQSQSGLRNTAIIEVQMPNKTGGYYPKEFEVQMPPTNNFNFKGRDVAIAGTIGSYNTKQGFLCVVLNASQVQMLGKGGSQTIEQEQRPQTQPLPTSDYTDNLPF